MDLPIRRASPGSLFTTVRPVASDAGSSARLAILIVLNGLPALRKKSDLRPTIWPVAVFFCLVEVVAHEVWAAGRVTPSSGDSSFERASALKAVSPRNRFDGLLERHEGRLRRLAYGLLTDKGRVDDVLQEAFVRAYRKLPARFESERHEAAWLYRIVYRCCLNELRATRRRRETASVIELDDRPALVPEPIESMLLAEALRQLPPDQRAVLLLVDLFGFDYETAAAVLHSARGTIAWRLNIARTRLRHLLEEDDCE